MPCSNVLYRASGRQGLVLDLLKSLTAVQFLHAFMQSLLEKTFPDLW